MQHLPTHLPVVPREGMLHVLLNVGKGVRLEELLLHSFQHTRVPSTCTGNSGYRCMARTRGAGDTGAVVVLHCCEVVLHCCATPARGGRCRRRRRIRCQAASCEGPPPCCRCRHHPLPWSQQFYYVGRLLESNTSCLPASGARQLGTASASQSS